MPTPSMLASASTYNWISSMDAVQSILKPEIDPQLVRRYGDQNLTGFLEMQGSTNPVAALQYTHFEDDWLHTIVKNTASFAGGANATVSLTVAASYIYTFPTGPQAPYIVTGAATTVPLQNQDVIEFPNGVQALVTNVNAGAGTYDATPVTLGQNIPAVLTTDEIIITGSMWPEGTAQPEGRESRLNRYTNNLQILKRTHTTTGSAMGVQTWVEVTGVNGQKGYLWYYEGQLRVYKEFKNEKEVTNIVGQKLTNTVAATIAGQSTNASTEALLPFIANNGNTANYSLIQGVQLSDFETFIATQLDKNRGATENTLWCGINFSQGVDAFMRDTMKNGAISYGAFGGSKEKAISFNFSSFELTGYTFHKKTYDVFNYPQMLGAAGHGYSTLAMVIPSDNVTTSVGPEKTKMSVPSLRINYLSQKNAGGSYSRLWEEWLTGGANGVFTNQTDSIQYNLRSHCGFEGFAGNRFSRFVGI